MRTELKILGLTLGLSVLLAQGDGNRAIGVYLSKDGIKALSTRMALGGNPYLSATVMGGVVQKGAYVVGFGFQHLFEVGGGCRRGACYRRASAIQPYLDLGMRLLHQREGTQNLIQGAVGGGILLPVGPVEVFGQVHGIKPLSDQGLQLDFGGGLRLRF